MLRRFDEFDDGSGKDGDDETIDCSGEEEAEIADDGTQNNVHGRSPVLALCEEGSATTYMKKDRKGDCSKTTAMYNDSPTRQRRVALPTTPDTSLETRSTATSFFAESFSTPPRILRQHQHHVNRNDDPILHSFEDDGKFAVIDEEENVFATSARVTYQLMNLRIFNLVSIKTSTTVLQLFHIQLC